ncbi:MAG: translocation/assembly module TamB domain-containing protein [Gammaproteobacteria bacterium]|nr:translocation/assembly module TamB domain-containing protein [Gammaproteobacteria bacterium]
MSSTPTPPPADAPKQPNPPTHWGRWLAAALLVPALLVLATLGFVLGSERGLRFGLAQLASLTDNAITVRQANGRLFDQLELRDFRYISADGLTVSIGRLALRHRPATLLGRRLHVESLVVHGLDIRLAPPPPIPEPDTPTDLPSRLPVDIVIDALSLADFVLRPAAEGAPPTLEVANSTMIGNWLGDRIIIKSIDTTGLPLTGPLHGEADLSMGGAQLDFESLAITGPGRVQASGRLGLDSVASDLKLAWQQLHWPLNPADGEPLLAADLVGSATFTGRFDAYRFDLNSTATLQDFTAKLSTQGSGSLEQITLDDLSLDALPVALAAASSKRKTPAQPGSIKAHGTISWSPALLATIEAAFSHVDPSWFAADLVGDINGRLSTSTTMTGDEPTIAFDTRFDKSSLRGQPFELLANGITDTRSAKLAELTVKAGKGSVAARGSVAWRPALRVDVDATMAGLDPAIALPEWPGELNGHLTVKSDDNADGHPIRFEALIEKSRLRDYRLRLDAAGDARISDDGTVVRLERAQLESGGTTLEAQGQVTPPFALTGSLNSPNLGALLPELSGRAALKFALDGSIEQPHLVTDGSARDFAYGEQTIARLDWQADIDPKVETSKLSVELRNAELGLHVDKVSLSLSGLEVYHRVLLDAATERGNAKLGLIGGFDRVRGEWGGELNLLSLAPDGMAAWALEKPAGILIGQQRRALEPACLNGRDGHACFNLEQNVIADGARFGWNIDRLLLSALQPFLGEGMKIAGSLDGEGFINFSGGDLQQVKADVNLRDATVDLPDAPTYRLETGRLTANQTDGRLDAVAELKLSGALLNAEISAAPGNLFKERALGGNIRLDVPSLKFIEPLLPQFDKLDGRLSGDIALSGTVGDPRYTGDVKISDGAARLVVAGIDLTELNLLLKTRGNAPLSLEGQVKSGGGQLAISGEVNPYSLPVTADIKVTGKGFQAMNTPQARAWIDADLQLVRDAEGARLNGELGVPRADITPKGLGGGGVDVSDDQVLVGVVVPVKEPPLKVFVDLKLVLGSKVQIEGFGLKTRIEGGVNVTQRPGFEAMGRGELRLIDGRYQAYGQDLSIETGRLIFSGGPVTTPAIDLYATRQPREDIKVGVRVRGTLAKPELSLQSSPSLPREQQLSWLVLGRSLENSSTQDRSLVSSAALSLGLGGGDYLAGLIGKKVGLDQFSVGSATGNNSEVAAKAQSISGAQSGAGAVDAGAQAAQLTLGKYLTPKLFVSYGISLFQEGYTFRMLYTLGRGFKLSTESGTASGGDLIYTTERGKTQSDVKSRPARDAVPAAGPAPDPTRSPDAIPAPDPVIEREREPATP